MLTTPLTNPDITFFERESGRIRKAGRIRDLIEIMASSRKT